MLGLVFACGVLPSLQALARAQEREEPPAEAIEYFNAGRSHYEAGRYAEAAESLENALTLDPGSAVLLFNLARVYELLGDLDQAVVYGQRYRDLVSEDPEELERAETMLRRLEGARDWLALRAQAEQAPPELLTLETRVIEHQRGVVDSAFWGTLGAGVAVLAVGGAAGAVALLRQGEANDIRAANARDITRREDLRDDADRLALVSDIAVGVGAATVVAALLLYILRTRTVVRSESETVNEARVRWTGNGMAF